MYCRSLSNFQNEWWIPSCRVLVSLVICCASTTFWDLDFCQHCPNRCQSIPFGHSTAIDHGWWDEIDWLLIFWCAYPVVDCWSQPILVSDGRCGCTNNSSVSTGWWLIVVTYLSVLIVHFRHEKSNSYSLVVCLPGALSAVVFCRFRLPDFRMERRYLSFIVLGGWR